MYEVQIRLSRPGKVIIGVGSSTEDTRNDRYHFHCSLHHQNILARPHILQAFFRLQRIIAGIIQQQYCRCSLDSRFPDRTRTKKVTSLESNHRHHRPARAAFARTACGCCFDPKREATAPGCRACSGSQEHRVGSLVGQDQTHALTAAAVVRVYRYTSCQSDLVDNS